ncbi:MAG TPA: prepilin-type N-terminal cleavage/methylation domain-containing protein [Candidatus Ozemobacteraceae bacterium]
MKAFQSGSSTAGRPSRASRLGVSLIEMIIVVSIISILAVLALPTVELFDMKARERLLRDRLYDMRLAIDRYRNARMDNVPPTCVASLLEPLPATVTRSRTEEGPFLALGQTNNPFSAQDDVFRWDLRFIATNPASTVWLTNQSLTTARNGANFYLYDVRFPTDSAFIGGWQTAFDGTRYSTW